MLKKHVLKKNWEFKAIINREKQFVTKYLIMYYKPTDEEFKIGISVSKKFANAVLRNRYKRQVRSILTNLPIWSKKYNVVLILRKEFLQLDFQQKTLAVKQIFEKFRKD